MNRKRAWEIGAAVTLVVTVALAAGAWHAAQEQQKRLNQELIDALDSGEVARAEALSTGRADPNAANPDGYTALCMASAEGDVEWVKRLLARGARVNTRSAAEEATPLLYASGYDGRVVTWRIPYGASGTAQSAWRAQGSRADYRAIVKLLLAHGADPETPDEAGDTPLIAACANREFEIARHLVQSGANVNPRSRHGPPPLLAVTAAPRQGQLVRLLLERGADPNAASPLGTTPLMNAAFRGEAETVRLLLEKGADPMRRNSEGRSAMDIARQSERADVVRILQQQRTAR